MVAGFHQSEEDSNTAWAREKPESLQSKWTGLLYSYYLKVIGYITFGIFYLLCSAHIQMEGITQEHKHQEAGILEGILWLPCGGQ